MEFDKIAENVTSLFYFSDYRSFVKRATKPANLRWRLAKHTAKHTAEQIPVLAHRLETPATRQTKQPLSTKAG
ncbi:MAG: hypothetical protein ACRCUY_08120 [Thermoguttaceae bacterium]